MKKYIILVDGKIQDNTFYDTKKEAEYRVKFCEMMVLLHRYKSALLKIVKAMKKKLSVPLISFWN